MGGEIGDLPLNPNPFQEEALFNQTLQGVGELGNGYNFGIQKNAPILQT